MVTGTRGISPTVRRRRLGTELRRYRESAGLTIEQVAEHMGCSSSKISRLETGQIGSSPQDVRQILTLFQVGEAELVELVEVARQTRQRGWRYRQSGVLTSDFVEFEQAAAQIRSYEAQCVPGLLQTENYARTILASVATEPEQIESRVRVRMQRRSLLVDDDPVRFWCVIDEAVLLRPVGGAAVMRQQVEHLVAMSAMDNVTLQVLPLRIGAHAGMDGSFALLRFEHDGDPETVYVTTPAGGLFQEKPDELAHYVSIFQKLTAVALTPEDSTELMNSMAKESV
ncbi:MAG TPA: helix-turn-helix transcriptional regulator [Micromonosporaceae bacterium]|jgi:transcriptional regulator with XRE-family HTH domain